MRITRWVLKAAFIVVAVLPFKNHYDYYTSSKTPTAKQPVPNGVYTVTAFFINHDGLPLLPTDSLRWRDLIFEDGSGSMQTADTVFRHRHNRAYFNYALDSARQTLFFKKRYDDSLPLVRFRFNMPGSSTLRLWGKQKQDSLYVELKRTQPHFQMAEKQFHWLSEYNR